MLRTSRPAGPVGSAQSPSGRPGRFGKYAPNGRIGRVKTENPLRGGAPAVRNNAYMRSQRQAAFGLWAALTFSCAVVVHGVIHAAGDHTFVWDSPAHVVMLVAALAMLAGVALPLGLVGRARERRRRMALVRAGLGPMRPALIVFGLAVQAGLAVALLAAEGATIEPDRLVVTLLCGFVALLCSGFLFRATRDRVIELLTRLIESVAPASPRATLRRRAPRRAAATITYRLFVPNRPPPAFAR